MILLAALGVALAFLLPSSGRAANPQLCATVGTGDAFVITLQDASCTTDVTRTDPGTYDIVVHDNSAFHNFHLTGPGGVDMTTGVAEITPPAGVTWTLTLVDGTYTYTCDPHLLSMTGSFTVGASPPPPPPPPPRLHHRLHHHPRLRHHHPRLRHLLLRPHLRRLHLHQRRRRLRRPRQLRRLLLPRSRRASSRVFEG
jgi:hypothetical protein